MSTTASPAPMMNRSSFQRPSPMGSGMRYRQQMPGSMDDQTRLAREAERLTKTMQNDPNLTGYDPNMYQLQGPSSLSDSQLYPDAFQTMPPQTQQPIMPLSPMGSGMRYRRQTPVGAQPQGKMGGGYPAASSPPMTSPVSGDPGMAGGGMTPTTQPVGVSVPVDVQPFIAGRGEFMGGGSYGAPARGSDTMPEDYADLYGGRFGRGR